MKYAIIEDEQIAMQNIDQMIRQLRPHYQKFFQTDTAEETIKFLMSDLKPDFLFMDMPTVLPSLKRLTLKCLSYSLLHTTNTLSRLSR